MVEDLELVSPAGLAGRKKAKRFTSSRPPRPAKPLRRIKYNEHDLARFNTEDRKVNDERSDFEIDRSRIVHSSAFRRLQGKTQVFTVGESDFFRTRMTHSLEVAQIAKGIALRLGADPDLVETISLAHDLGHPPFGHAGEDELKRLMRTLGGFEANAQNIRILRKLETKDSRYLGLNLTRAALDGQLKYKKPYSSGLKKFFYDADQDFVTWSSEFSFPDEYAKSFECQIMDWADEIAYSVHDFEDGLHSGFITGLALGNNSMLTEINTTAHKKLGELYEADAPSLERIKEISARLMHEIITNYHELQPYSAAASFRDRKAQRKMLTSKLINRFIQGTSRRERSRARGEGVSSVRYLYEVIIPPEVKAEQLLLNNIVWMTVMRAPQVMTLEAKGRTIIRALFFRFLRSGGAPDLLPSDWRDDFALADTRSEKARVISDYISGMTDLYAQRLYARLFIPFEGSVFEVM